MIPLPAYLTSPILEDIQPHRTEKRIRNTVTQEINLICADINEM